MLLVPEAPIFGHGLASWPEVLQHPVLDLQPDAFILGFAHPHNEYLNLLVKVGIVGTALFFAPMLVALAGAGRLAAQRGRRIHAVVIAWFVGAHLIYACTDVYSEWTTNMLFLGIFLGMLIWLVPNAARPWSPSTTETRAGIMGARDSDLLDMRPAARDRPQDVDQRD
jgi:O-antigen ligase